MKKILLLAAKRWNAVSKSMPVNMAFSRKLNNLIEQFSKMNDSISESSTNVTDKKNDEDDSISDNDRISDNDSQCELFRDIYPDEVEESPEEKNSKGLNNRIKSKTPLGDMLNSLLRKRSSTQIFEGNESDAGESSSFVTFPVLIANGLEQLESHPLVKRNIDYHENEPNLRLINDPKGSSNSSHNSAVSVDNFVRTDSIAQHEPNIRDVRTSLESSRPPMFNSITDDSEALKLAKRKRRVMRNERRIRKVSRALKRESKYNLSTS